MSHRESWNHWERYDEHVANELRRLVEVRYGLAAQVACDKVFDAGCGHGYGAFILGEGPRITHVIAADKDAEAIGIANVQLRGAPKISLRNCDLEQMPAPRCHWVVCTEVLEHLNDPEGFIAKMKAQQMVRGMVLSWPLGKTSNRHHTRCYEAGDMQKMMGDWRGEMTPMAQRNPKGKSVRNHELGVFRRPS